MVELDSKFPCLLQNLAIYPFTREKYAIEQTLSFGKGEFGCRPAVFALIDETCFFFYAVFRYGFQFEMFRSFENKFAFVKLRLSKFRRNV